MKPETEHVAVLKRRLCKRPSFSQPSHRYREAVRHLGIVPLVVTLTGFPTVCRAQGEDVSSDSQAHAWVLLEGVQPALGRDSACIDDTSAVPVNSRAIAAIMIHQEPIHAGWVRHIV